MPLLGDTHYSPDFNDPDCKRRAKILNMSVDAPSPYYNFLHGWDYTICIDKMASFIFCGV
jgi:hypothetical protein